MRRFVQPPFLRRVTLVLSLCWFIPLLGALGAGIFFAGARDDLLTDAVALKAEVTKENIEDTKRKRMEDEKVALAGEKPNPAGNGNASVGTNPAETSSVESGVQREKGNTSPAAPVVRSRVAAAEQSSGATPSAAQNSSDYAYNQNLVLLARIIFAEARGESIEGQVAVGAVLLNRVKSPNFPNNLWSNIFRSGEFCTVRDGQIWLEPNASAYRAARLALNGWDPTYGAVFFYNPARTTSRWIWSRSVTTRIGRHVFAR